MGETKPKASYTWGNYKWGTQNNITKYNTSDGLTQLELNDGFNTTVNPNQVYSQSITAHVGDEPYPISYTTNSPITYIHSTNPAVASADNDKVYINADYYRGQGKYIKQEARISLYNKYGLVMDAIKSNAGSIGSLAAQMGCSTDQLQSALNNIQNTVTSMGYQSQLANCGQTNTIEKNFAQTNYNIAEQTCALRQNATDNADRVIAKLDAIEDSRKDREINTLTAQLAAATAKAEREAELAPITKAISEIQAKQPSTATIPYPNLVGVPANQFYGYNTGVWG